jgi:hypothetical protein
MTTAFQYIFDKASSISINKRAIVAQTITRDEIIRSVSRGGQVWRFTVSLPNGIPWSQLRPYIEGFEKADRYTVGTVQINNAGYNSWFMAYQGNSANSTGFYATWTTAANTITLTTSPTTTSGYKFRAGDLIQLGTGNKVYSVASDVAYNSNTVTLNRPILDSTASTPVQLLVGPAVTWSVVCTEFPDWDIFARDQVNWSGSFKFAEYML